MSVRERRERDRASREQLIVTAARELAEAEGWDAVTTRRLAERVEYSQPVLYSHFAGKAGIVRAVALEGFSEMADELRHARTAAPSPGAALPAVAAAYLRFAQSRPAVYDAMFVMPTDIPFGMPETPPAPRAAFAELRAALAPLAGHRAWRPSARSPGAHCTAWPPWRAATGSGPATSRPAWTCWPASSPGSRFSPAPAGGRRQPGRLRMHGVSATST